MLIIIIIISILLAITLIIAATCWYQYKQNQKKLNSQSTKISSQAITIANQQTTIAEQTTKINQLEHSDDNKLTELKTQIFAATNEYQGLCETLERKHNELAQLEISFSDKQKSLQKKLDLTQEERIKMTQDLNDLREKSLSLASNFAAMQSEEQVLKNSLDELKIRYQEAIIASKKEQNSLGIKFMINDKEQGLIHAIDTICEGYPELSRDLRKIEWEKIWRPKIQTYRSELSNVQGIYKLTLVRDEDICYVGQARNIYDRWFEHMKKMIGMDAKGNEKLYEYGIGDFYWSVLEEVDDAGKLNDAEKYWIEYFGCVEVGLNKKV